MDNLEKNTGIDEYPEFNEGSTYNAGDVVSYNGLLYQFTVDHTAGAWTGNEVQEYSLFLKTENIISYTFTTMGFLNADGQVGEGPYIVTDYIEVSEGDVFKLKTDAYNIVQGLAYYDQNKNKIATFPYNASGIYIIPRGVAYIRACKGMKYAEGFLIKCPQYKINTCSNNNRPHSYIYNINRNFSFDLNDVGKYLLINLPLVSKAIASVYLHITQFILGNSNCEHWNGVIQLYYTDNQLNGWDTPVFDGTNFDIKIVKSVNNTLAIAIKIVNEYSSVFLDKIVTWFDYTQGRVTSEIVDNLNTYTILRDGISVKDREPRPLPLNKIANPYYTHDGLTFSSFINKSIKDYDVNQLESKGFLIVQLPFAAGMGHYTFTLNIAKYGGVIGQIPVANDKSFASLAITCLNKAGAVDVSLQAGHSSVFYNRVRVGKYNGTTYLIFGNSENDYWRLYSAYISDLKCPETISSALDNINIVLEANISKYTGITEVNYKYDIDNLPIDEVTKQVEENLDLPQQAIVYKSIVRKPFDFNGKKASFVGDSITYGFTTGTTFADNNWVDLFSKKVGLSTKSNNSVGGALFVSGLNEVSTIPAQIEVSAKDDDFLFIAGGTNDFGLGADMTTFRNTISNLCDYINNNFSQSTQVIWITPINRAVNSNVEDLPYTLQDYRNAITEEVIAKDTYNRFSIVQGNEFNFPTIENPSTTFKSAMFGDNLHPSQTGYNWYAVGLETVLL